MDVYIQLTSEEVVGFAVEPRTVVRHSLGVAEGVVASTFDAAEGRTWDRSSSCPQEIVPTSRSVVTADVVLEIFADGRADDFDSENDSMAAVGSEDFDNFEDYCVVVGCAAEDSGSAILAGWEEDGSRIFVIAVVTMPEIQC